MTTVESKATTTKRRKAQKEPAMETTVSTTDLDKRNEVLRKVQIAGDAEIAKAEKAAAKKAKRTEAPAIEEAKVKLADAREAHAAAIEALAEAKRTLQAAKLAAMEAAAELAELRGEAAAKVGAE